MWILYDYQTQFADMKCETMAIRVWNAHLELPPSRIRDGGIDTWAPRPMLYYLCHGLQIASAQCCLWCRPHSWSFHPHLRSSARQRGGLGWLRLFHLSIPAPKIQVATSKLSDLIDSKPCISERKIAIKSNSTPKLCTQHSVSVTCKASVCMGLSQNIDKWSNMKRTKELSNSELELEALEKL